ncbi:MAG: DUF6477 family protein [Pseudomonadota bacterium]
MSKTIDLIAKLRRPPLLIRAARFGMRDYNRSRDLQRLLPGRGIPAPHKAVEYLVDEERELEATRILGDASYSVLKHVRVMIALLGEVQLAKRSVTDAR